MASVAPDTPDYKSQVARAVGTSQAGPDYGRYSGVYFFLSLDLVNSTAYKAGNPDWKYRIRMFYDEAKNFWRNHQASFHPRVWKYAGDEVLFYAQVHSVAGLQTAVQASYAGMRRVSSTVQAWTQNSSPPLFVKATCWAARAQYQAPAPGHDLPSDVAPATRNIVFQSPLGSHVADTFLDFLGPEIDAGFRIAAGSIKKSLVVSAEVAHLLWTRGERTHGNRLRVVAFRELKGVWEGRHYPLVWYREDWSEKALDDDYEYDDRFRSDMLSGAYTYKDDTESAKQLPLILKQVNRTWFDGALPNDSTSTEDGAADASAVLASPSFEVHCVAVCFADDGKVLVAKRAGSKTVSPGCWEAGCAELRPGDDFARALQRDYLSDFGLNLDFLPFEKTGNGVVGSYSFEKRGSVVPGVIFVARVCNPGDLNPAKHAEARWVDPNALPPDIQGSAAVPDLAQRIQRAYAVWKSAMATEDGQQSSK